MKISEYEVTIAAEQEIDLPVGSKILEFDIDPQQPDQPIMWVLRPSTLDGQDPDTYTIKMCSKEVDLEPGYRFISSLRLRGGTYKVFIFETAGGTDG